MILNPYHVKNVIEDRLDVDLKSRIKKVNIIDAKRLYFGICNEISAASKRKIAGIIGLDHSTGHYHSRRHNEIVKIDKNYRINYQILLSAAKKEIENPNFMSVKWIYTLDHLRVLVNYFENLENDAGKSRNYRVMRSAIDGIGLELRKKLLNHDYKKTAGKKDLSTKLNYHEAHFLQIYLGELMETETNDYNSTVLLDHSFQLEQKLA